MLEKDSDAHLLAYRVASRGVVVNRPLPLAVLTALVASPCARALRPLWPSPPRVAFREPYRVPDPAPVDRANPVVLCVCGHNHPLRSLDPRARDRVAVCCPTCRCRFFRSHGGAP